MAREAGIRLIGPDSMGIMRPSIGLNVSYWPHLAQTGSIGLLCQSGAVTAAVLEYADRSGIGFSTVISSGLESEVSLAEMIDFLVADPQTEIIALHVEALRHPRGFFSSLKNAVRQKPVIVLKAGRGTNARRLACARLARQQAMKPSLTLPSHAWAPSVATRSKSLSPRLKCSTQEKIRVRTSGDARNRSGLCTADGRRGRCRGH